MKKLRMILPLLAIGFAFASVFANKKANLASVNAWVITDGVVSNCNRVGKCIEYGSVQCSTTEEIDDIPAGTLLYKRNGAVCTTILLGEFEE